MKHLHVAGAALCLAAVAAVAPQVATAEEAPSRGAQIAEGTLEPGVKLESAVAAAPCGLTWIDRPGYVKRYTIRNCHDYGVWRKLDIRLGADGDCHYIAPNSEITRDMVVRPPAAIRGMKAC